MNRIAIIGNGGGGKTTLARSLGTHRRLPVHHVDSIQFLPGWGRTPQDDCDRILDELADSPSWIIDGFGSREVIQRRLEKADTVVFVRYPLWQHYWWALKRQLASRKTPRAELPADCPEFTLAYTKRLVSVMWRVHREHIPWFDELIAELPPGTRVYVLRSPRMLRCFGETFCVPG